MLPFKLDRFFSDATNSSRKDSGSTISTSVAKLRSYQRSFADSMQTQLRCRTTAADGKMRQDKFFKLKSILLRWNRLPPLIFSHFYSSKIWTITYFVALVENPTL